MISLVRTMQWRKPVVAFLLSITFGLACIYKFKILTKVASGYQRKDTSHKSGISVKNKTGQESSRRYGKVIHGTDHVIIYNSVPKCGSRTFQELSIKVFKEAALPVTVDTLRSPAAIENNKSYKPGYIQKLIARAKAPVYFQGHGPLVTFDKNPQPVYINFIRDPVSRMVSSFYFRRYGDGRLGVIGGQAPEAMKKMTIEDCILKRVWECTKPGKYPEIFCGSHPRCGTDHKWALQQAKSNIDKYYTFIGITEDYEASLTVLERLMPDMYNGSIEVYHLLLNRATSIERSKTKNKKPLSQKLNDTVTKLLAVDYELYNYIYDKHRRLKVRFGIG